jgi:hypothetical protein
MQRGDKYITLQIGEMKLSELVAAVLERRSIPLWPVKDRKEHSPNFRGHGIAAWVNEYPGAKSKEVL